MATFTFISSGRYNAGTRTLSPVSVPVGCSVVKLTLDVTELTDPTNTVTYTADLSLDGGTNWSRLGAVTFAGGPLRGTGPTPRISNVEWSLPEPQNANRQVRASATIAGPRTPNISASCEVR